MTTGRINQVAFSCDAETACGSPTPRGGWERKDGADRRTYASSDERLISSRDEAVRPHPVPVVKVPHPREQAIAVGHCQTHSHGEDMEHGNRL